MTNINVSEGQQKIVSVFRESFLLLRDKPKFFLPKLFSTFLGAIWFLGLIEGKGSIYYYLVSMPFLTFLGFFVSVMVAGMVKNSESENLLKEGFSTAVDDIRSILSGTMLLLLLSLLISIPLSAGIFYYVWYGETLPLIVGTLITLATAIGLSFSIYFLPISIIEEKSALKGFKKSKSTAFSNSREVFMLTLFSFALLGLATFSQGYLEKVGQAGFVVGRLVSAVVTTYLFVISPKYYLE